jgi:hypothetical protein
MQDLALQLPNLFTKDSNIQEEKNSNFFLYGLEKKGVAGGNFIRSLAKLNDPVKERKNPARAHTHTHKHAQKSSQCGHFKKRHWPLLMSYVA